MKTLLLLALLATSTVFTLALMAASTPAPKAKLGSTVFDWARLEVKPTKVGERRDVVDAPTATLANFECHITTVNAGEAPHAPHRHPDEEIIFVKEGTLEVMINGQTQRAGAGSMFFFASNDLHGMRNVGEGRATYHVMRIVTAATPKPAPAAK